MKTFLRALIFTLCLLVFSFGATLRAEPFSASADETTQTTAPTTGDYACVVDETAFFYSAPDETKGLFLLPVTYYVRLLDYGATFCRIEYFYDGVGAKKLVGYAKTASLAFVDYVPKTPYFYYVFDLRYTIGEDGIGGDDFLDEITATCTYYGDFNVGSKTYCYVLRDDSFGYVPKPSDLLFRENPEYEAYLAEKETSVPVQTPVGDTENENSSSPAQIAILVALCLLIPVLATLILRPARRRRFEPDDQ